MLSRYGLALSLLNDFSYLSVSQWFLLLIFLTHILYQQPDIESLPDGGSVCWETAMNFSSSCPVNFPPSLVPQTTYYFMLLSFSAFFHPGLSFICHIYLVSPHDAVVLFHYLETGRQSSTLGWNWSSCQSFRQTRRRRCVSVWLCVFEREIIRILVSEKKF